MRWSISNDSTELYFEHNDIDDGVLRYGVYERNEMAQTTQFGQRYSEQEILIGTCPICNYASIRRVTEGVVSLHYRVARPILEIQNTTFWLTLHSFPNRLLRRNILCYGDGEWIHDGILNGSLVIVHDGSYNPKGDTALCSAGFVIFGEDTGRKARGAVAE